MLQMEYLNFHTNYYRKLAFLSLFIYCLQPNCNTNLINFYRCGKVHPLMMQLYAFLLVNIYILEI